MNNSIDVTRSFVKAASAGNWTSGTVSVDEPYILYITSDKDTIKSFIKDLVSEVDRTDGLFVDRYTNNSLTVRNLEDELTIITIADSNSRLYAVRSHTGKRPSVLVGTDLDYSDKEKELVFSQFLPMLSPVKYIVDLGAAYDARVN